MKTITMFESENTLLHPEQLKNIQGGHRVKMSSGQPGTGSTIRLRG